MGLTVLEEGSVWNSIPAHTHTRRTEIYFYFDLNTEQRLFHMMGETTETRHIIMKNHGPLFRHHGAYILVQVLPITDLSGAWAVKTNDMMIWIKLL